MQPDIHRLIELHRLLSDFNQVERAVHRDHLGTFIAENDTEHSYNLAMAAWYLVHWFPELDANLVIKYSLVHDLVEVHAGDTSVYAHPDELKSKPIREAKALEKLRVDWADFLDMIATIEEYEHKSTAEARFVYALDKVMPIVLIFIHEGYTWKKNSITLKMLHAAKLDKVKVSPEIKPYYDQLYKLLLEHPEFIKKS